MLDSNDRRGCFKFCLSPSIKREPNETRRDSGDEAAMMQRACYMPPYQYTYSTVRVQYGTVPIPYVQHIGVVPMLHAMVYRTVRYRVSSARVFAVFLYSCIPLVVTVRTVLL